MSDTTDTPKYRTTSCDQWVTSKGNDGRWIALSTTETADELNDLERQLVEAMEQLAEWRTLTSWGGTPEIISDFIKGQQTRIHAAQNAEEQRDRLAEALRQFMAVIDSHDIQTEDCDRRGHLYCDCLHRARKPALEALATLDRKEQTSPPSTQKTK